MPDEELDDVGVAGTGSLHQRGAVALHTAVLNIGPHCQQHLKQLNRVIRKSSFTTMKAISSRRIRAKNNMLKLSLGVSICLDVVSIETLDLDTEKKSVSTAEKISTVSKS